jgi:hypothetical protein
MSADQSKPLLMLVFKAPHRRGDGCANLHGLAVGIAPLARDVSHAAQLNPSVETRSR